MFPIVSMGIFSPSLSISGFDNIFLYCFGLGGVFGLFVCLVFFGFGGGLLSKVVTPLVL